MITFTKREILHLSISIIILSFVFGFDDGYDKFVLGKWLANFFSILLLVVVSILFRELAIKVFAERHEATSEYELWKIKYFWFNRKIERGNPLGIILAFVLVIASNGKLFFTAIGSHILNENKRERLGRKFATLTYYEEMQIITSGILASLFLIIVGLLIENYSGNKMTGLITINLWLIIFNMIPFSSLDGAKIFFGSLLGYIFLVIFVVVALVLIKSGIISGLLIALIVASIITTIYYYLKNK